MNRHIGDQRNVSNSLGNLGLAYAALGELHRAIELYEQELVIDHETGDRPVDWLADVTTGASLCSFPIAATDVQLLVNVVA